WPNQLDLQVLHQHSPQASPMDEDFDYAVEFAPPCRYVLTLPRTPDGAPGEPGGGAGEERVRPAPPRAPPPK
ncbi:hypothetical protein, partial [Streptomyces zaomyceticus]|uniref:hypothetical protein n=1 Tax=Streptomyces zaomyceticus TaxID=68286 RepID=UPI00342C167E